MKFYFKCAAFIGLNFLVTAPIFAQQLSEDQVDEAFRRAAAFLYSAQKATSVCPGQADIYAVKKEFVEGGNKCPSGDATLFAGLACAAGMDFACESILQAQDTSGGYWRSSYLINRMSDEENVSTGANVAAGTLKTFSRDHALGVMLAVANHPDRQKAKNSYARWINRINQLSDKTQLIDLDGDTPESIEVLVNTVGENFVEQVILAPNLETYNLYKCIVMTPKLLQENWKTFWSSVSRVNSMEEADYLAARWFSHWSSTSESYLKSALAWTNEDIQDLRNIAATSLQDATAGLQHLGAEGQKIINKVNSMRIGGTTGAVANSIKNLFGFGLYNPSSCNLPGLATFSAAGAMNTLSTWICPHEPPADLLTTEKSRSSWQGFCSVGETGLSFVATGNALGVSVPDHYVGGAKTLQEEIDFSKLAIETSGGGFVSHVQFAKAQLYASLGVKSTYTSEILGNLKNSYPLNPLYALHNADSAMFQTVNSYCPLDKDWSLRQMMTSYRWESSWESIQAATANSNESFWDCVYIYSYMLKQNGKKDLVKRLSATRGALATELEQMFPNPSAANIDWFVHNSLQRNPLSLTANYQVCKIIPIFMGDLMIPVKSCKDL